MNEVELLALGDALARTSEVLRPGEGLTFRNYLERVLRSEAATWWFATKVPTPARQRGRYGSSRAIIGAPTPPSGGVFVPPTRAPWPEPSPRGGTRWRCRCADPTYDSESTRQLYPTLPLFEGFPYLVTRVVPAMYHLILLPATASELELVLLASTQWRANRLETRSSPDSSGPPGA